jgi:hypothetical protein
MTKKSFMKVVPERKETPRKSPSVPPTLATMSATVTLKRKSDKLKKKFFNVFNRVARWFIFQPKIPFWVNIERLWNRKCWFGFGHLENFMDILCML